MSRNNSRGLVSALLTIALGVFSQIAWGQDDDKAAKGTPAEWIRQLDSNRFSQRQQASQKLLDAGKDAIPVMLEAGLNGSREAGQRSVEILKKHLQSADDNLRELAKEALEKIAKSSTSAASKAAEQAVNPKKPANEQDQPFAPPFPAPRLQLGAQQIQLQFGLGNGATTKRMNVENGVKKIDVSEKDRKIKIVDDPNNGIQVEVTETKDGKEETKKYEAKTADELKKNHPDAHKLYEEHSKNGIEFNVVPGALQIQQLPVQIDPRRLFGELQNRELNSGLLDKVERQLNDAIDKLDKAKGNPSTEDITKALEALKSARKEIQDAREKPKPQNP